MLFWFLMIITFCGHADFCEQSKYMQKVLDLLQEKVGDNKAEFFLGGYGRFDSFAFRCCKLYKQTHPNVSLVFIMPYITEEYQKNHFEDIKSEYDYIIYPEIENKPPRFAIIERNKYMVEKADCVIAYVERTFGGAWITYQYAKRKRKEIFNIPDLK